MDFSPLSGYNIHKNDVIPGEVNAVHNDGKREVMGKVERKRYSERKKPELIIFAGPNG